MIEHALRYAIELKWPIIPVGKDKRPLTIHGSKDATCDERTIRDWFTGPKTYVGIGLATGKVSGIAVLDIDLSKESCAESVEILKSRFNFTPSTVRSKTGSGGEHHFYAIPEGVSVKNAVLLHGLQGIDVRGNGGYVVLPPSENMSGVYEWMPGCSPFDGALPPVPDFMCSPKTVISISTKVQAGANGGRNNFLTREAGRMRAAGMEYAELLDALRRKNRTECAPPLQDDEVRKIAESISKYPPAPNINLASSDDGDADQHNIILNFPATDMGRAELIRYMYAGHIKYNARSGVFYLWDTPRWRPDNTGEINTLVVNVSRQLQRSAATIGDEAIRKAVLAKAKRLESADGITSALKLFKTLSNVATLPEEWDSDVNLLGVANGVVDLRTGQMLDPDSERLISLNTNVPYEPAAPCHRWEQFLLEVTDNDETLVKYLQKAVGYSLTGHTSEQCFFLLVGAGANGKSVFMNTLMEVFGDYGIVTPFSTFERTVVPNTQSNDIAALDGKRFVASSETTISSVFNEARLKQLTGDEQVSARFLHKEYFTFKPKLKLWLSVNHPPKVRDDSYGFWRRVRRINFPIQFNGDKADPLLQTKLHKEREGILAWAVRGAVQWYKDQLNAPESVMKASEDYRADTDPIADFIFACCIVDSTLTDKVSVRELYRTYSTWARDSGVRVSDRLSYEQFKQYITPRFAPATDSKQYVVGVRIKPMVTVTTVGNKLDTHV